MAATRHYYTSLPAAAYMSSEFGLTFEPVIYILGEPRYYIHDHNSRILDPHPGDMIVLAQGDEAYTRPNAVYPLDKGEKIIMRAGKAFIPPIVERL